MQKFCLGGRFIFGPDVRSVFLTIFLIVAPAAVFCVFVARKLMDEFSGDWGIAVMVVFIVSTVFVSSISHPEVLHLSSSVFVQFFCSYQFLFGPAFGSVIDLLLLSFQLWVSNCLCTKFLKLHSIGQ